MNQCCQLSLELICGLNDAAALLFGSRFRLLASTMPPCMLLVISELPTSTKEFHSQWIFQVSKKELQRMSVGAGVLFLLL